MFFNTANAEVLKTTNSFDNSKIVISYFHSKELKIPKTCTFKKCNSEYYLTLTNSNKSYLISTLEPIKIKTDNTIYSVNTNAFTSNSGYRQLITAFIPQNIIQNISIASQITLQVPAIKQPVDIDEKNLISYLIVDIPQNYIEEWKQVINMN